MKKTSGGKEARVRTIVLLGMVEGMPDPSGGSAR